jgi:hypothetical protein
MYDYVTKDYTTDSPAPKKDEGKYTSQLGMYHVHIEICTQITWPLRLAHLDPSSTIPRKEETQPSKQASFSAMLGSKK